MTDWQPEDEAFYRAQFAAAMGRTIGHMTKTMMNTPRKVTVLDYPSKERDK